MSKYFVPTKGPDDWRQFLADPDKQWKSGYSAKELAYSWESSDSFPEEVKKVLETHPSTQNLKILMAMPEYQVPLPGGSRPSQNDLFVLARSDKGLVVIMVEGKASESFGPTLGEWRNSMSEGKKKRLAFLQEKLQLDSNLSDDVRYQLLHRVVSPLIVAQRFHASTAIMFVHSFSGAKEWFDDYATFLGLFGVKAEEGVLQEILSTSVIKVLCGWVTGEPTCK